MEVEEKMKQKLIFIYFAAIIPCTTLAADYLEETESPVYETKGTAQEIAKQGKSCIAQIVRNEEVRIADSAAGTGVFSPPGSEGHSDGIEGGAILIDADIEQGVVSANNRVDYTSSMLAYNVKSTITLLTKDGRFKIKHTNIEYVQKNTGSTHNNGYIKVGKWWGTGWKKADAALQGVSEKVSKCIQASTEKEDW
jgi:hypothetical protein